MGAITTLAARATICGGFTSALDLSTPIDTLNLIKSKIFTNGTGTDQVNSRFHDTRTVTGAPENLDLAGGITDSFGVVITFTTVKLLFIHNKATTTANTLSIEGSFVNNGIVTASEDLVLGPDGILFLTSPMDGYTVTAGTGDILTVDPGANTITYDIVIAGTV